jgi:Holliday junction DNA helicase RuvB
MELIGNENVHKQISISITSAIKSNKAVPHILLSGVAGCGKTSTARKLAEIMGVRFISLPAQEIKTREDVVNIVTELSKDIQGYDNKGNKLGVIPISPAIVFVDEIHGMPVTGQEHLGILMEEWAIPITDKHSAFSFSKGYSKPSRVVWSPEFTLVGATTNDGLLTKPFRERFKLRFLFSTYNTKESIEIIKVHAKRLCTDINEKAANEIAIRGKGVPRILVNYLERCVDFAKTAGYNIVDKEITKFTFEIMGIDQEGLGPTEINMLKLLMESGNFPLGLDNLATFLNESKQVITNTIEPYLIQRGFITRSPRGRLLTEKGYNYLVKSGYVIDDVSLKEDIPVDYKRRL